MVEVVMVVVGVGVVGLAVPEVVVVVEVVVGLAVPEVVGLAVPGVVEVGVGVAVPKAVADSRNKRPICRRRTRAARLSRTRATVRILGMIWRIKKFPSLPISKRGKNGFRSRASRRRKKRAFGKWSGLMMTHRTLSKDHTSWRGTRLSSGR